MVPAHWSRRPRSRTPLPLPGARSASPPAIPPPPAHRRSNNSLQSSTVAAPLCPAAPAARPPLGPGTTHFPSYACPQPLTLPGVPLSYLQPQAQQLVSPLAGLLARQPASADASLSALTALLYARQPEAAAVAPYSPALASAAACGPQAAPAQPPAGQLFSMPSWGPAAGLAAAPSLALGPSADLGPLFGPADLPMPDMDPPSKQESGTEDDWLCWDGWQVGFLSALLGW